MNYRPEGLQRSRSSRERYRSFVQDYKQRRLEDQEESGQEGLPVDDSPQGDETPAAPEAKRQRRAKRRQYLREYTRWLWPQRHAVGAVFLLALVVAGLE